MDGIGVKGRRIFTPDECLPSAGTFEVTLNSKKSSNDLPDFPIKIWEGSHLTL